MSFRPLLFSEALKSALSGSPFVVVDVGARGGLSEPWSSVPNEMLELIAFEPDERECRRLAADAPPNWSYVPRALWSSEAEVEVHFAEVPSCSSVHPPNEALLARFASAHREPRRTRSVLPYPAVSLDSFLAESDASPDFVKIDTQGAEYEILVGARRALERDAFGVLVETWTAEVHAGQRTTGDVLLLLKELGFSLFDVGVAAAWRRRTSEGTNLGGKLQVMGLDLLCFRDPPVWRSPGQGRPKALKAAAIAQVFGFPDYALEVLEAGAARGYLDAELVGALRAQLAQSFAAPRGFRGRLRAKLAQLRGRPLLAVPPLHT